MWRLLCWVTVARQDVEKGKEEQVIPSSAKTTTPGHGSEEGA